MKILKVLKIIGIVLLWIFLALSVVVFFSVNWLLSVWSNLSMDELVYHLTTSLEGTNVEMIKDYIFHYGIFEVLTLVILLVVFFVLKKKRKKMWWFYTAMAVLSVGLLLYSFIYFDKRMGFVDYVKAQYIPSSFIEENYVAPDDVNIEFPEKKKNVIYIYLESMEVTYTDIEDGGAFQENIIPELVDLAREGEDFSGDSSYINGGVSLNGSTWTMGAMFAQSTGLPLKTSGVNANYIASQESIYPSVKSIGEVLQDAGYTNELLIGSNATFGGRRVFYSGHGDYKMFDYLYAQSEGLIPEDYYVFWGFEDEKLFNFAKEESVRLSKEDKPFNLTLLTADTHFEDGYVCRLCEKKFYNGDQYSNCMACSSKQVYEFVEWLKQQDFYEDTVIVLCGDHPTMDSDFCSSVSNSYQRKVYTSFINAAIEPEDKNAYREYTTMDMFPTTLAAMGVKIEGDRLGLGTNIFSSQESLIEKYGIKYCNEEIEKKSKFMNNLNRIELNDGLIQNIAAEATITPVDTEDGLEIDFKALAQFSDVEGFKALQAEVSHPGEESTVTISLDGYNKEKDYYYNTTVAQGYNTDNSIIVVYFVDKNDKKYELTKYTSE